MLPIFAELKWFFVCIPGVQKFLEKGAVWEGNPPYFEAIHKATIERQLLKNELAKDVLEQYEKRAASQGQYWRRLLSAPMHLCTYVPFHRIPLIRSSAHPCACVGKYIESTRIIGDESTGENRPSMAPGNKHMPEGTTEVRNVSVFKSICGRDSAG